MAVTLEQFANDCQAILKEDPGPSGRRRICAMLEKLLRDAEFVNSQITETTPERKVLYEDRDLGFCILAHQYKGARDAPPHDHGPSWAIYGQATGETDMTDYALVAPATEQKPGKARPVRTYKLTPGSVHLYNEGDLHAPSRKAPTGLIRLEGINMDRIKRRRFDVA
jgi:hypothetical protein